MFPLQGRADLPPELHNAWDRSLERRGEAKFVGGVGHNPELLQWYFDAFYQDLFYGGCVAVRYKELGRLRLSEIHGCRSCNQGNRLDAADAGLSVLQIEHIGDAAHSCFSASERAVLALADLVSLEAAASAMTPALYADLREHFSDAQIVELGMVFGLLAGMARFLFAFDLVEKEPYCRF